MVLYDIIKHELEQGQEGHTKVCTACGNSVIDKSRPEITSLIHFIQEFNGVSIDEKRYLVCTSCFGEVKRMVTK